MQEPGEWYEYSLRGLSDTLTFRASPRPGPANQVSFVVYGDMGESDHDRAKSPGYVTPVLQTSLPVTSSVPSGLCFSALASTTIASHALYWCGA